MSAAPDISSRAAILASLTDPLWYDASDAELADHHRVSLDVVAEVRTGFRQDLNLQRIIPLLTKLRERLHYPGSLADLLHQCVSSACARAWAQRYQHPDPRMEALRLALREDRIRHELERLADEHERGEADHAAE